jgi:hypothetical protein
MWSPIVAVDIEPVVWGTISKLFGMKRGIEKVFGLNTEE